MRPKPGLRRIAAARGIPHPLGAMMLATGACAAVLPVSGAQAHGRAGGARSGSASKPLNLRQVAFGRDVTVIGHASRTDAGPRELVFGRLRARHQAARARYVTAPSSGGASLPPPSTGGASLPGASSEHSANPSPPSEAGFSLSVASWYEDAGPTACGFHARLGVASKSRPCGSRVTFRYGHRTVTAVVDDRGPYVAGRDWDFNQNTAAALGFSGVDTVLAR
ncbi:MAG: septal ring lytic transglycosylase RlpA family protein [Solirubrobacteraceae bacterium]